MSDNSPRPGVGLRDAWLKSRRAEPVGSNPRDESRVVPPMLYLPVRETSEGGRIVEIRQTRDGRRALLAFTALDRLAHACGARQAWALVATASLDAIQDEQSFDLVAFDPEIPSVLVERGRLA